MEQDVDNAYSKMCNTCLSSDRDLILLDDQSELYKIFRVMMYDFAGDGFVDSMADQKLYACWECVAMIRRFSRFKRRVHTAQEHLRVLCLTGGTQEPLDHTYLARSLSTLEVADRSAFDKIYFDYTTKTQTEWSPHYIAISTSDNIKNERYDIAHIVKENINLELDENVLSGMVLENPTSVVSPHIVINAEPLVSQTYKEGEEYVVPDLTIRTVSENSMNLILEPGTSTAESDDEKPDKTSYITQYINEEDMMALREDAKQKILYASSIFKCELCVLGFYNQQQVEEHYVTVHKAGLRISPNGESNRVMNMQRRTTAALIRIGDAAAPQTTKSRKKRKKEEPVDPNQEQDMKKLLSKTTIVGYKCLECDMFFKNYRARNNHVARYHREGLQCDHCKKRFVNKTTLATHLRLHEGPPPRAACPVCGKQVRVVQLKYHVQRHQSRARYECAECAKSFSHLATYQAHLKYSRAHATDQVFKFPCPMCNKGYPTKEAMQDHFNYQHLGKTSHKCPVCNKPIASKANVEKHMMRIHGDKKERPRNHVCQQCGKAFTDKKALKQHEVIHSGDRPLSCEICQQTFKQKASLYTHKKRVHNVVPPKRVVEFMETKSVEA